MVRGAFVQKSLRTTDLECNKSVVNNKNLGTDPLK